MSELNNILEELIVEARQAIETAKGMDADKERFAMSLLEMQECSSDVLAQAEEWTEPDHLVELVRMQAKNILAMTDRYVSCLSRDRQFLETITALLQRQITIHESDKALNIERDALLAKLNTLVSDSERPKEDERNNQHEN